MKFGKIDNPQDADLHLPPDPARTERILREYAKGKKHKQTKIYIGCAKWGRKDWVGKLYPAGTREKDFFDHYVEHFNSIELNATHYRFHKANVVKGWADRAPEGFRFCPKFHQLISHRKWLKDVDELTDIFFNSISGLGDKLGYSFLQVSEKFTPKMMERLEGYLRMLPDDARVCLELRHPDWFLKKEHTKEIYQILEELRLGTVITDTAGRRDALHMGLTIPVAFIRFVGNDLHPSDYERIDDWIERIGDWVEKGLETLYFFMHQPSEANSPVLTRYMAEKLNETYGLELKVPELLNGGAS